MTEGTLADRAHAIVDAFYADLEALDSYESYRRFILKYFQTTERKSLFLNVIMGAEIGGMKLKEWEGFQPWFMKTAHEEFAKKQQSFANEEIRLGFSL